jgi:thymidylate synthase (FAD)
MKIVTPSVSLIWITPEPLKMIELAGRTAYKSEDRITDDSAAKFVKSIMERGHESVIEHASASMRFVCDRGVSHELVRHRLFSITQESTRYVSYAKEKHGSEIQVIQPPGLGDEALNWWMSGVMRAELAYLSMILCGQSPQIARSVLPTCLKTEVVVTGNFREWRHFFKLRTAKAAHPQMREVACEALRILKQQVSVIFDDIDVV